jgi:hypothetical protein
MSIFIHLIFVLSHAFAQNTSVNLHSEIQYKSYHTGLYSLKLHAKTEKALFIIQGRGCRSVFKTSDKNNSTLRINDEIRKIDSPTEVFFLEKPLVSKGTNAKDLVSCISERDIEGWIGTVKEALIIIQKKYPTTSIVAISEGALVATVALKEISWPACSLFLLSPLIASKDKFNDKTPRSNFLNQNLISDSLLKVSCHIRWYHGTKDDDFVYHHASELAATLAKKRQLQFVPMKDQGHEELFLNGVSLIPSILNGVYQ